MDRKTPEEIERHPNPGSLLYGRVRALAIREKRQDDKLVFYSASDFDDRFASSGDDDLVDQIDTGRVVSDLAARLKPTTSLRHMGQSPRPRLCGRNATNGLASTGRHITCSVRRGLGATLTKSEQARRLEGGRAGLRRLNAYEYENAIRDLLNVPWVQIKDKLPQDGVADRFNKAGRALDVSHVQLARYIGAADYAVREAMASKLVQPPTTTTRVYARQEPSLVRNFRPREGSTRSDRHNFPVRDSHAQPDVRAGRSPVSRPETKEREAVG